MKTLTMKTSKMVDVITGSLKILLSHTHTMTDKSSETFKKLGPFLNQYIFFFLINCPLRCFSFLEVI